MPENGFFSNRLKIRMTQNNSDHKWPLFQTITRTLKWPFSKKNGHYGPEFMAGYYDHSYHHSLFCDKNFEINTSPRLWLAQCLFLFAPNIFQKWLLKYAMSNVVLKVTFHFYENGSGVIFESIWKCLGMSFLKNPKWQF